MYAVTIEIMELCKEIRMSIKHKKEDIFIATILDMVYGYVLSLTNKLKIISELSWFIHCTTFEYQKKIIW